METPEAIGLRDSPGYLREATHKQLAKLLTALICEEEFVEGSLAKDFESGLLRRIARRASVLSSGDDGVERECALERREGLVSRLPDPPFNVI